MLIQERLSQPPKTLYWAVVLLGPTGSGKTPLGELMARQGLWGRRCVHFDFGALLRQIAAQGRKPSEGAALPGAMSDSGTSGEGLATSGRDTVAKENGRQSFSAFFTFQEQEFVRKVLQTGALLEDEHFPLAIKILQWFLVSHGLGFQDVQEQTIGSNLPAEPGQDSSSDTLIVLNGLPRHVGQAEALSSWLDVQAVVHLECPAEVVLERIRSDVGGDRQGRPDDDPASIRYKLATYAARTEPLIDYYRTRAVPVVRLEVTATMSPAVAWKQLQVQNPWAVKINP